MGKWLREHLGGGSKSVGQEGCGPARTSSVMLAETSCGKGERWLGKGGGVYTPSQNLYCSLPREHGRHGTVYNSGRKLAGNCGKPQGQERQQRCAANHHEKMINFAELGTLTRGGPIYGSEGKTPSRKRNRDRRRHSLNEIHEQGRQRRKR